VKEIYLFWTDSPDFWVDVSASLSRRVSALMRHASQLSKNKASYEESIRKWAREAAQKANLDYEYAEAFKLLKF
jgi:hypothetical protein